MEILKVKKFNAGDAYSQGLALTLIDSHKFSIDIKEVFGGDFTLHGTQNWLGKMPDELMPFLNLPHNSVYMEFSNGTVTMDNGTMGMLAWNAPSGIVHIVPTVILNGVVSFIDVSFDLGVKRKLEKSDFNVQEDYSTWQLDPLNKSGRFAILDLSDGRLPNNHIDAFATSVTMLLESLLYINAKGVGTTTNHPKIKKHIKRKSPLKEWTYKTLRIVKKGEPTNIHHHGRGEVPFIPRNCREHTVRGHIAIYTKDRPLFGNPKNVGPIWISPHVRNQGTEGKVIKDYNVE